MLFKIFFYSFWIFRIKSDDRLIQENQFYRSLVKLLAFNEIQIWNFKMIEFSYCEKDVRYQS